MWVGHICAKQLVSTSFRNIVFRPQFCLYCNMINIDVYWPLTSADHVSRSSDVPKGGPRGPWPFPERPQGAPQAPEYFSQTMNKTFTRKKNVYQSFIHILLVTRGAPDDPMGPCSHPRAPGFLGPLSPRGPPGNLGAPSRAGGPLLGEILGTCLPRSGSLQ